MKERINPSMTAYPLATALAAEGDLGELVPTMSIVYYAPDAGPEYQQAARILAEDFGKLGLDIEMRPLQQSSMVSQIHVDYHVNQR